MLCKSDKPSIIIIIIMCVLHVCYWGRRRVKQDSVVASLFGGYSSRVSGLTKLTIYIYIFLVL